MDTDILNIENDTSHLDLLVFEIDNRMFGINVAKVKEVINYQPLTIVPKTHPSIEGIFMPREDMITVIDLKHALRLGNSEPKGNFILTNFNSLNMAFHVDSIKGIHSASWQDIMKPNGATGPLEEGLTTGIIKHKDSLIIVLDFEKIVTDINPDTGLKVHEMDELAGRGRIDIPILVVEDSVLLNRLIVESLGKAGYKNLTHTANGQEAWDLIEEWRDAGTLDEHVRCVITDIEMPIMDGHKLTKLIKEGRGTNRLKVVIFSSMINDATRKKGEELGADVQMTKPEIGLLVGELDKLLGVA
ncbi:MAG: chemotaxis protein CheV [Lachnospiraceae bacterium]|nr:chemotaxis protein CheV [Lachnospiraceae bacterium]